MADDRVTTRLDYASSPQGDGMWAELRRMTAARIGLRKTGASLATGPLLDFQLAHARARDAVHKPLDEGALIADLGGLGDLVLAVSSEAEDRQRYLMRPDLGRRLSPEAETTLASHKAAYDVVFVITAGLSAGAVQDHALPVLARLLPALRADGWRIAPLVIVRRGRVGVGDAVATVLGAAGAGVLIGERPGLSATDSMGAYLTWQPHAHTTDADRNCVSNIRPDGCSYDDSALKLAHLLRAMRARRISGIRLKDDSDRLLLGGS